MEKDIKKDVNYYMSLPYTYVIQQITDESGTYYYARILELDGCQSTGDTFEDAYESIKEAMEGWLEVKLQHGDPIPEPIGDESFSGKFVIRLPKSLHKKLVVEAKKEGVSLNQYALYKLSK
ncbi:type II toxin-antitoxin system HicB family antitoxin [Tepidanaerobacter syntrophicus]|uniref:type II toxin-antitoxin system HicB family antitoxin n=2 Tax=Tepidanaerobacter TaxID=499228 RepID=UPI000A4EAD01|nr:type II toxin-antitoxin system HicB family antitoxin [Tepidanaerobacter syntrophicus]